MARLLLCGIITKNKQKKIFTFLNINKNK